MEVVHKMLTRRPIHHISRPFIRPKEQQLGFLVQIDDGVFDPGCDAGDEEVDHCLDAGLVLRIEDGVEGRGMERTSTYFSKHSLGLAPSLSPTSV